MSGTGPARDIYFTSTGNGFVSFRNAGGTVIDKVTLAPAASTQVYVYGDSYSTADWGTKISFKMAPNAQECANLKITVCQVTIADLVRDNNTAIPFSVRPGGTKSIAVTVLPNLIHGYVQLSVVQNNTDTLSPKVSLLPFAIVQSTNITAQAIAGVPGQTEPGIANKLQVRATTQNNASVGEEAARSTPFAVCAHPANFYFMPLTADPVTDVNTNEYVGMTLINRWRSDTGTTSDQLDLLNEATRGEDLAAGPKTNPPFSAVVGSNSPPSAASYGFGSDQHWYPKAGIAMARLVPILDTSCFSSIVTVVARQMGRASTRAFRSFTNYFPKVISGN
jgi:hypothetical protein